MKVSPPPRLAAALVRLHVPPVRVRRRPLPGAIAHRPPAHTSAALKSPLYTPTATPGSEMSSTWTQ